MVRLNQNSHLRFANRWLELVSNLLLAIAIGTPGIAHSQGESSGVEQQSAVDVSSQAGAEQSAPAHLTPIVVESAQIPNAVVSAPAAQTTLRYVFQLGVTLVGIVIAAFMIVWQMGKQHRSSLDLQKENTRAELRAEIYSTLIDSINQATSVYLKASSYVRFLPASLKIYRDHVRLGMHPLPVKERSEEIHRQNYEMTNSVIRLLSIFESYAIAVPEFGVFQDAFNSAIHDVGEAFDPLFQGTLRILPVDAPAAQDACRVVNEQGPLPAHVIAPLTDNEFQELDQLVERYLDAAGDIACYIYDLRVEAQSALLSDLYPNQRAPRREPRDPIYRVVTVENAEELKAYFRNETPWGRNMQRIDEETRRDVEQRAAEARGLHHHV